MNRKHAIKHIPLKRVAAGLCSLVLFVQLSGCQQGETSSSTSDSKESTVSTGGDNVESGKNIWQNAAEAAMKDVLQNFWYQDVENGHLIKTDHGLPMAEERQQGMMWEHATMVFVLETYADMTGSEEAKKRLAAQWQYTLSEFNEEKRTGLFGREPNIAADDAGWGAMAFMAFYRATGDIQALKSAGELVNGAYDHWAVNGDIAQGMYYNDERRFVCTASAASMCAGLDFYIEAQKSDSAYLKELGNTVLEKTKKLYGWMTDQMQRNGKKVYANNTITVDCDDKLFWMCVDVDEQTGSILPQGYSRPMDIREAGSVSSLFGNMAMGIVNAKLFHITGETLYCERAVEIAKALTASSSYNINGCFLNDRDAWANGSFVGAWVKEVLTLDGITAAEIDMITNTAASIQKNCRTDKGYYRAEWLGGNAWTKATQSMATPTVPEQIMTTANTVHFIVAAGLAEAKNLF